MVMRVLSSDVRCEREKLVVQVAMAVESRGDSWVIVAEEREMACGVTNNIVQHQVVGNRIGGVCAGESPSGYCDGYRWVKWVRVGDNNPRENERC